jgi:hypothetical protein
MDFNFLVLKDLDHSTIMTKNHIVNFLKLKIILCIDDAILI